MKSKSQARVNIDVGDGPKLRPHCETSLRYSHEDGLTSVQLGEFRAGEIILCHRETDLSQTWRQFFAASGIAEIRVVHSVGAVQ